MVIISSDSNKIFVFPNTIIRETTNMNTVARRLEFDISNDQIQEIRNAFGPHVLNHAIIGQDANQIMATYVMPLIESSPMHSLFLEILNPF
jgi:hypothetical protein